MCMIYEVYCKLNGSWSWYNDLIILGENNDVTWICARQSVRIALRRGRWILGQSSSVSTLSYQNATFWYIFHIYSYEAFIYLTVGLWRHVASDVFLTITRTHIGVNWIPRKKSHWNFNQNTKLFSYENVFQNVISKVSAILLTFYYVDHWKLTWMISAYGNLFR